LAGHNPTSLDIANFYKQHGKSGKYNLRYTNKTKRITLFV